MFGFNKYAVYAVIALIVVAVATTYILMWKHSIRQQALLEFNNKQLEQVIKDQQKFMSDMKTINDNQRTIIDSMNKQNEEFSNQLKDLEGYLGSDVGNKDSEPSSEVLKKTIKQLGGKWKN